MAAQHDASPLPFPLHNVPSIFCRGMDEQSGLVSVSRLPFQTPVVFVMALSFSQLETIRKQASDNNGQVMLLDKSCAGMTPKKTGMGLHC